MEGTKNLPSKTRAAAAHPASHVYYPTLLTPCIQRGKTSGAQFLLGTYANGFN